ncbi:nucleolus protein [Schizopora paradoxa]|uniref:25S rRNA adenine-N(1) methyltransferase n=1 Tax=Schizopora paradoxa TaxID=27342 RepID=A0A0H2RZK6_9AGAM|nr:nucleolus protein [Schizopora paradoxa]
MTKSRKKKAPVTSEVISARKTSAKSSIIGGSSSSSSSTPQSSRTVIRKFHVLLKRKAQLEKKKACPETSAALDELDKEVEELGGLAAYQRMSSIGQGEDRGGGSEKVFIGWLREMEMHKREGSTTKLRLLEVGALKHDNYASCSSWIDCEPIDLRSRHPAIREQDFLRILDDETLHQRERWDAISLSLVVNFVADARDRGRMLCIAYDMLKADGLLFLALPLPCVSNSRYMTLEHLEHLMLSIGFAKLRERWKVGGKMAYWLFRKCTLPSRSQERAIVGFEKKKVLREGGQRNNFSILLD